MDLVYLHHVGLPLVHRPPKVRPSTIAMAADGQTDRQTDGQTDRQTDSTGKDTDRQRDRQRDRETDRQTDVQTNRHADIQTNMVSLFLLTPRVGSRQPWSMFGSMFMGMFGRTIMH